MATPSRKSNTTLARTISDSAKTYNLDQLIKIAVSSVDEPSNSDICDRIDEVFYFRTDVRYAIPESKVSSFLPYSDSTIGHRRMSNSVGGTAYKLEGEDSNDRNDKWILSMSEFGILSFNSPLPHPFVEWVFRELNDGFRSKDHSAMLDFIDIFNHRFLAIRHHNRVEQRLSLQSSGLPNSSVGNKVDAFCGFYDARKYHLLDDKYNQKHGDYRGASIEDSVDRARQWIQAHAGLIFNPRKTIDFVTSTLKQIFKVPVSIDQFRGQWLDRERDDIVSLGVQNSTLGGELMLGRKVWDQNSLVGVSIGPISYSIAISFLPAGGLFQLFKDVIRFVSEGQWDCLVSIEVMSDSIPKSTLSSVCGKGLQLNRLGWIQSRKSDGLGAVKLARTSLRGVVGSNEFLTQYLIRV